MTPRIRRAVPRVLGTRAKGCLHKLPSPQAPQTGEIAVKVGILEAAQYAVPRQRSKDVGGNDDITIIKQVQYRI